MVLISYQQAQTHRFNAKIGFEKYAPSLEVLAKCGKQAGAELGQAQLQLKLELSLKICCINH